MPGQRQQYVSKSTRQVVVWLTQCRAFHYVSTHHPASFCPHVDAELVVALVAFVKCWQKHATRAFVMSHRFDIVIIEIYYQKKANVPKHHTPQWCPRELHYIAYVRPFLKAVS